MAREGDRIGRELGIRLTVVLPDGEVAADSTVGAGRLRGMENHSDRPEVVAALSGKTGTSLRRSITLGEEERYLAVPVADGGRVLGAARVSIPVTALERGLARIRLITFGTGLAAFLLMLAGTAVLSRRMTGPIEEMRAAAGELASGNLRKRIAVKTGDELEELAEALNRMASRLEEATAQRDEEKARLVTLLSAITEGAVVIGRDRTVRWVNREAAEILGIAGSAAEGRPYAEVIRHPEVLSYLDDWRAEEKAAPREVSLPSRAGERMVRLAGTFVRYPGEKEADLLLTLHDLTEEKRLARMKSDFVSNASHELRTPLTNIRGYLEAVQDSLREGLPVDPAFPATAHANALRMERLIDDLLELSRAESGLSALEKAEAPLPSFLERIAASHRPEAERLGKALTVQAEDILLRADARTLSLALSNLVDNAIKHGKEGGKIRLAGTAGEGKVLIEVEDDGPGIPPEHLSRIFERFYRVDKARSRELGGTGLGLSIARHIVEAHGGTIRVESRLGVGTRFLIRLPA
jgi:two-component system phosphate regulon sensor histidine kinase PhoR